jgi:hypothetical protein
VPVKKMKSKTPSKRSRKPSARLARESNPLAAAVHKQVTEWAKQKPDEVVIGTASSKSALTREAIRNHLEKETDLGQRLMKGWMDAAVRSVIGAKTKI